MNAGQITEMLRAKYSMPRFAFVSQVPNATSSRKTRTCDGIAIGCWQSVGIQAEGFEIKVARGDWRKELQDRNKSATFETYCHHWWIVAPKGVVKLEEMPGAWGLLIANGSGLRVEKAADLRTPETMPLTFVAAMLRRAIQETGTEKQLKDAWNSGYMEGRANGRREAKASYPKQESVDAVMLANEQLRQTIEDFEKASGIQIKQWTAKRVGEDFAAYRRLRSRQWRGRLSNVITHGENIARDAKLLLEAAESESLLGNVSEGE